MVVKIRDIGRAPGATTKSKRKGRGIGSGRGKTSGRGHKGAKSRSGGGKYTPGFEGGQMPLVRRIPKRGFTNIFKTEWNIVNIGDLEKNKSIKAGTVVDRELMHENGMLGKKKFPVKILGKGKLTKSLTVKADAFSGSAKKAVEEAGGKIEVI
ncbi:MAG: 50S ribosomal protein L15 [Candidatus Omnitrophota bacterium]